MDQEGCTMLMVAVRRIEKLEEVGPAVRPGKALLIL